MKKYLLFSFDQYYPIGGIHDYCGDYDSIEEAKAAWDKAAYQCEIYEIVEHSTMKNVEDEEENK